MVPSDFSKPVDVRDVRMVQRGEDFRFALEPREAVSVTANDVRQHLDRDWRFRFVSRGAIDLTHAARADLGSDFIGAEARAGGKGQRCVDYRAAAPGDGDYSCLTP